LDYSYLAPELERRGKEINFYLVGKAFKTVPRAGNFFKEEIGKGWS